MTTEELEFVIQQGEGYNIEFKRRINKELGKEICAFSNASGGVILLGITDDKRVEGVPVTNEFRSKLQNIANSIDPRPEVNIDECIYKSKRLMMIECKPGKRKPYIHAGSIYVRIGQNSRKLTAAESIRDFFQHQNRIYFDESPCNNFIFEKDFDKQKFNDFIKKAGILVSSSPQKVYERLGLCDNNGIIKCGAALFFAKDTTKYFSHAAIRCLLFNGVQKRHVLEDTLATGSLPEQLDKAMLYLKSKLKLQNGAGANNGKLEIPEVVFREALVNALTHRDYYNKGGRTNIEIYDNRIEITNPGGLVSAISVKQFGRQSLSRNPLIFELFRHLDMVKQIGSGIPRMYNLIKEAGLPPPRFSTRGIFVTTFYRPANKKKQ